uniref:Putative secreted protein n=1 Tax=Anopheles triannulatus TaxID=58253 RepID=A0A2M4B6Y9_9DIPT
MMMMMMIGVCTRCAMAMAAGEEKFVEGRHSFPSQKKPKPLCVSFCSSLGVEGSSSSVAPFLGPFPNTFFVLPERERAREESPFYVTRMFE